MGTNTGKNKRPSHAKHAQSSSLGSAALAGGQSSSSADTPKSQGYRAADSYRQPATVDYPQGNPPASWSVSVPPATGGSGDADYDGPHMPSSNVRRVRKKKHRVKKGRIVLGVLAVVIIILGVYGAMLFSSAQTLRHEASTAMTQLSDVQDAITKTDFAAASDYAYQLQKTANTMNDEMSSPLWTVASCVPVLSSDVSGARTLVSVLQDASANALVPLTESLQKTPISSLISDGTINVASAQGLLSDVQEAAPAMQRCTDELSSLPPMHIGQLQQVVDKAQDKIVPVNDTFQQAAGFAGIAGDLLGVEGARDYLIVAQNTAEMRAGGGFPGSVGSMSIDNGKLSLGDFSSLWDSSLGASVPPDYVGAPIFGLTGTGDDARSTNVCPDYPFFANCWAYAYEQESGTHVDGVIAMTPAIVQNILSVVGPITLSDGTQLDGTNATMVLEHDLYWKYLSGSQTSGMNDLTDELFAEAASKSFDKLINGLSSKTLIQFSQEILKGMDERTFMLWLSDAQTQEKLAAMGCSGALGGEDAQNPELGVYIGQYAAIGSKMGMYLDLTTTIDAGTVNADGTTTYNVRTTYTNTATDQDIKNGGMYILGDGNPFTPGDFIPEIYLVAPKGGSIGFVTATSGPEFEMGEYEGLQVAASRLGTLMPSQSVICTYTVTTAAGAGPLKLSTTPTLTEYRK